MQLLLRYPCLLHQVKDQLFHIHHRGDKQGLFRRLRLQRLHGKPRTDADPVHTNLLPYRLHPGIDRLQLPGNHPRHQLFRAVFSGAVLRQIDSQHLPACRASCAGKAGSLGCAAVFAMDIEIDLTAALAVQDSRNACNLELDFFHNGSLLFWGRIAPCFLYDSTSRSQTQTGKSCYHPYCKNDFEWPPLPLWPLFKESIF